MKDLSNYSLLSHNTFGIDAQCKRFLEYASEEEAVQVASILAQEQSPFLVIGGGSNLLLTADYPGTVVHSAIKGIQQSFTDHHAGQVLVRVGSGEIWDETVEYFLRHGWYGAENLSLIPGEVGAAAVQNIGAYGAEASSIVYEVEAVEIATGRKVVIPAGECHYGYRQSRFKQQWKNKYLITHVVFRLSERFSPHTDYGNIQAELARRGITEPTPAELRQVIIDIRQAKLPDTKVEGNAGSFFMNPVVAIDKFHQLLAFYPQMPHYPVDDAHEKIPAGWLIDQCGWRGRSLGRAGVHDKQALVLVNRGGATGHDIVALCQAVRRDVLQKFGIEIQPEVNII